MRNSVELMRNLWLFKSLYIVYNFFSSFFWDYNYILFSVIPLCYAYRPWVIFFLIAELESLQNCLWPILAIIIIKKKPTSRNPIFVFLFVFFWVIHGTVGDWFIRFFFQDSLFLGLNLGFLYVNSSPFLSSHLLKFQLHIDIVTKVFESLFIFPPVSLLSYFWLDNFDWFVSGLLAPIISPFHFWIHQVSFYFRHWVLKF